jgi:hypothetical protein
MESSRPDTVASVSNTEVLSRVSTPSEKQTIFMSPSSNLTAEQSTTPLVKFDSNYKVWIMEDPVDDVEK